MIENQMKEECFSSLNEVVLSFIQKNLPEHYSKLYSPDIQKILALSLISNVLSEYLDFIPNLEINAGIFFSFIGGLKNTHSKHFIPTVQTALFLLAGADMEERKKSMLLFMPESPLFKDDLIKPFTKFSLDNPLEVSEKTLYEFLTNQPYQYHYSDEFPASLYTTQESWEDLILPDRTKFYLQDIPVWMKHYQTLVQDEKYKKFTKGMKFLLHGEPGTGKSICVALFGKDFGKPVYRIDLSQVVSKWVGETTKNIGKIFDIAQNKDWILFFDEGDALFGKRTENNSANDRYGNQEIAYLLQRMEEHKGIIFMATNKLPNMDKAFVRRFQVRVPFPVPDADTRYDIWMETMKDFVLDDTVSLASLAAQVETTGASIRAFGRYCKLWSLEKNINTLSQDMLVELLQTHLEHEGKMWTPKR